MQDCVILLPWSPQVVWKQTGVVCLQVVQQLAAEMFPQAAPPQTMSLADAHQAAEVELCYIQHAYLLLPCTTQCCMSLHCTSWDESAG